MRPRREHGEGVALEALLRRGFRYALALSHDHTQAEDLVQDAWLTILAGDRPRHIGYFLRTIRNRFIDLARRRNLVPIDSLDHIEPAANALAWLDDASSVIDRDTLQRALGRLRSEEREALYLAAVEGYTVREIADLTGSPLGTVSSLIQRSRRKLRADLDRDRVRSAP